jgi:hypothetical protein
MVETPAQLEYAPQPHWRHRKRTRRLIFAGLVVVILAGSGKWIAPAWRHVCMLYWQEKCLSFEGGDQVMTPRIQPQNIVEAWDRFYALFSPPGRKPGCTVFVHEVRRKDGERRLVAIDVLEKPYPSTIQSGYWARFDATVIEPGSLWRRPRFLANLVYSFGVHEPSNVPALAIRYGKMDPNDPSHFTIVIPLAKAERIVDGWLGNNDQITLEMREN